MQDKPAYYQKFERDCKRSVCVITTVLVIAVTLIATFLHWMFALPLAMIGVYLWIKLARISWSVSENKFDEITREHRLTFKYWRRYVGA